MPIVEKMRSRLRSVVACLALALASAVTAGCGPAPGYAESWAAQMTGEPGECQADEAS